MLRKPPWDEVFCAVLQGFSLHRANFQLRHFGTILGNQSVRCVVKEKERYRPDFLTVGKVRSIAQKRTNDKDRKI